MNRPDSGANELPPGNNGAHSTTPPPLPSKPFNNGLSNPMINQVYYHSAATMPELENDSISLVVTSPPYFNVKDYSKNGKQNITHSEIKPGRLRQHRRLPGIYPSHAAGLAGVRPRPAAQRQALHQRPR